MLTLLVDCEHVLGGDRRVATGRKGGSCEKETTAKHEKQGGGKTPIDLHREHKQHDQSRCFSPCPRHVAVYQMFVVVIVAAKNNN